jgi:hypothetical protein
MESIVREPNIHIVRCAVGGQFHGGLIVEDAHALAAVPKPTAVLKLRRLFVLEWAPVVDGFGLVVGQLDGERSGLFCGNGCVVAGAFASSEKKRRNRD